MENTIFTQEFVISDKLVRPIIIGTDFTVSNFIGIIWTKQGTKKVTQDDRVVIEVKEPARGKTLLTTRRIAIPPRHYAKISWSVTNYKASLRLNQTCSYSNRNQTFGWIILLYTMFQKTREK